MTTAGPTISPIQFYQHFVNSLPADFDVAVTIHDPIPSNYSVDVLWDRFRAIELRKELRTIKGGTKEDPIALLAKQKGSRLTRKLDAKRGGDMDKGESLSKGKNPKVSCWDCGKKGHHQRDCRSSKKKEKEKPDSAAGGPRANSAITVPLEMPHYQGLRQVRSYAPRIEVAYTAVADGTARYYIDTGTPRHFIDELDALHDYIPIKVPRTITTAESSTIRAYGTGTL